MCTDEYYLVWDSNTISLKNINMFNSEGKPFFDVKTGDYDVSEINAVSDVTIDRADFNYYYNISEVADEEEKEEASSEEGTTNANDDISSLDYIVIYICVGATAAVILSGYIIWWIKKKNEKQL